VDAADDVGDDGLRSEEHAALDFLPLVVSLQEVLIEVDNGVFVSCPIAKVGLHGLGVGLIKQVNNILNAQFVEVKGALFAAGYGKEFGQQFPQEGVGRRDHFHEALN